MYIKLTVLFALLGVINVLPMSLSAVTFEDLQEAMITSRSCPIVEEYVSTDSDTDL